MLYGSALWRLAVAAELASDRGLTLFDVLNFLLRPLVVLEPVKRGVVLPRVHAFNAVSSNHFFWTFFRSKLVQEVVFFLISESVESIFEVLFNNFAANPESLIQVSVFLLLCHVLEAFEGPKTEISENRSEI